MEHSLVALIAHLVEVRYDWRWKSPDALAERPRFTPDVELPEYWEYRRALAQETLHVRRALHGSDQLACAVLDHMEREVGEKRWGIVLVLAEEFIELDAIPDESMASVRKIVELIHADLLRPRFAGWQPHYAEYRAWHLAVSGRLLARLADV